MEIGLNSNTGTVNWKYKNVLYSYVAEGIIFAAEIKLLVTDLLT